MLCAFSVLNAQDHKSISLNFIPIFDNQKISLNKNVFGEQSADTLIFETIKFYLSSFKLWDGNRLAWEESNSFHLLDLAEENTLSLSMKIPQETYYKTMCFNLGIDSMTNTAGVFGGDLDPTTGMYWTWQSGYINIKMEGKSPHCTTHNHEFQFHLGGYQTPFNACQNICLDLQKNDAHNILINFQNLFDKINLAKQNLIMSRVKCLYFESIL
ncbi:MAG: hypothetical protein IPN15_06430 [Saprospiraceae bacterium]|nr:hypothetical protein [Candidatus Vicinibacter affinis]